MNSFQRSTANIAAWNLEGFNGISDERIKKQIKGIYYDGRRSSSPG